MAERVSRKRQKSLKLQAERMRAAKAQRVTSVEETVEMPAENESLPGPSGLNESLLLPAPDDEDHSLSESDNESGDVDDSADFTREDADVVYRDWLVKVDREDKMMMAMMMHDNYTSRFGLTNTSAAAEVSLLLGLNEKTIRLWRKDFLANRGAFSEYQRGSYARYVVVKDEEYRDKALEWCRANSFVKGRPNMTASRFRVWVNETLLPIVVQYHPQVRQQISVSTAARWLHTLGFHPSQSHKGVYIDGHERVDVVQYRKLYLRKLEILEATHAPPPPCSDEPVRVRREEDDEKKKLILIYHDESTFHSNDGQGWLWAEEGKQPIRPKGQGRGIMVSDFIEEYGGFLALTDQEYEEARLHYSDLWKSSRFLLKYGSGSEGYWNSEKFLIQVKQALNIAEIKYPVSSHSIVFLFDQSSGHTAYAEDALNVNRMNVNPGGSQPKMHETTWNGKVQRMVDSKGTPKGMRQVLMERGIDVRGMKADDMRKTLKEMHDFKYEKTKVETLVAGRGHRCIFIPKYHCELNPIERVWGHAKQYTRSHCDYTFAGLERTIDPALDNTSVELIRKYYRKVREYAKGYREGFAAGPALEKAMKQYKSHRRVSEQES